MNSAIKQPVLPSPGNPTAANNTPAAINLNKTLSPTPASLPVSSPAINKPSPSSTPLNLGSTVSTAAKLPTNNITPYAAQPPSHPAPNIVSAHQNIPNAAHQQHPSGAAGQQAATAHQAHPQVAQDMQQASMQFNKQVNCSNPTVAAVNMVQEKVQSVPLPATANASTVALSIAATAPPAIVQKPPVIPSASINIPAPKTVSNGTVEPKPKEDPPKVVTPVKITPEPKPVVKEPEVKAIETPKKEPETIKTPVLNSPSKPPPPAPTPPVQKSETSAATTPSKEPVQISNTPKPKTEPPQKAPTPSPAKTATTTPRSVTKRKRDSTSKSPKVESPAKVAKIETPRSSHKATPGTSGGKRVRMRTQPYQSPIPEIALITKLTAAASTPKRPAGGNDDKLIAFYKNEFLAVRNAEGGFYVCQAVQNVYKTSTRIRIRWLSNQDKTTDIYIPDFYDNTEFDCILTNLSLKKLEKGKFRLPKDELERTENILKRALDVENGVADSADELTEEHPDGLDLSLLRDEDQLQKKRRSPSKKGKKRKSRSISASPPKAAKSPKKTPAKSKPTKSSPVTIKKTTARTAAAEVAKSKAVVKVAKTPKKGASKKEKTVPPITISTKKDSPVAVISRSNRTSRRDGTGSLQTSPVVDAKKAKLIARVAGRKATKAETPPPKPSEKKAIVERATKSAKATTSARGTRTARASSPATPQASASSSRRSITKRSTKK